MAYATIQDVEDQLISAIFHGKTDLFKFVFIGKN